MVLLCMLPFCLSAKIGGLIRDNRKTRGQEGRVVLDVQAVKLGPYVMAAITDGDREISLSPGDVANHVHDVDIQGLTMLRASNGLVLKQSGLNIALANESSCLSKMECTFRLARLQRYCSSAYRSLLTHAA